MDFSGRGNSAHGIPEFMVKTGLKPLEVETSVPGIFHIHGEICQVVHIILAPQQKIQCEPGTMCYTSEDCKAETKMGGIGRLVTEGNLFKLHYHNKSQAPGYVGLTANFPATIIPLNLDRIGGNILCKHDSFVGAMDPNCSVTWSRLRPASTLACCCSGLPWTMQEIRANGWVFLAAHGTIVEKKLSQDEKIVVDTNSVVAMTPGITVDVEKTGGCLTMCFGGEGMFNTALKGPGTVYLCSMPMEKLRLLFYSNAHKKPKKRNAAGNAAGVAAGA